MIYYLGYALALGNQSISPLYSSYP